MGLSLSKQTTVTMPQQPGSHAPPLANLSHGDTKAMLNSVFEDFLHITLKGLATLKDKSRAENFFLHFPSTEADYEFECMKRWLSENGRTVYSNRDENGWSRFVENSKRGVVIVCSICVHMFYRR
jgi:hypothetical protein